MNRATSGGAVAQVATRLGEIAGAVRADAAAATAGIRAVGEHAAEIARLACELDEAAALIEANVRDQVALMQRARAAVTDSEPVMATLAAATDGIGAISAIIAEVAGRSRLLALNARIEAARSGAAGAGFGVVAGEMTTLAEQTRAATLDIDARTGVIREHVGMAGGATLVRREERMVGGIAATAERQRATAATVATLTGDTVVRLDDAATTIGRVASAAAAMEVLARQVGRLAAA